jgi:hypothetical protein
MALRLAFKEILITPAITYIMKKHCDINYKCMHVTERTIRNLIEGLLCCLEVIIRNHITAQISFLLPHGLIYNQSNKVSIVRKLNKIKQNRYSSSRI